MSIKIILITALLMLSACGFSPMYASNGNSERTVSDLNNIAISIIPDRSGQYLRNALIDRFYGHDTPSNLDYRLVIAPIKEKVSDFDITVESEATRRQLRLSSQMKLIDTRTKKTVLMRDLLSITSHNVLESEFSTIVTEQSARDAALNDLARKIERNLVLYFNNR